MKALKVTISGSYRTATRDIVDFEDVSGIIPLVDDDIADMHVRGRYAVMWVKSAKDEKGDKLYKQRIEDMRQIFIDDKAEVDHTFSFSGKSIKQMSYEELQDLATFKDLRSIQLPKELSGVSLREMREAAYVAYANKVLGKNVDPRKADYDYAKLPDIFAEGEARADTEGKLSNDEIIEQEQKSSSVDGSKSDLTLNDLKQIADSKDIKYHPSIGFDALYQKLYSSQ